MERGPRATQPSSFYYRDKIVVSVAGELPVADPTGVEVEAMKLKGSVLYSEIGFG